MPSVKPQRSTSTQNDVESSESVAVKRPWSVIVWDDPVTPMTVVVVIFRKVFGYPNARANQLMLKVHHEGKANVWSGQRERAESYCVQLHSHGLAASIEQAS
jgi:ATP-dependent Clp protease adaptor protein ClpS